MPFFVHTHWAWFCVAFGCTLLLSFLMSVQARLFYTMHVVPVRFSIMDLELASSQKDLVKIIRGIFNLPEPQPAKTIKALRAQLWTDFLFMPAAYGAIFLLCMKVSLKMIHFGHWFFAVLAWLQLLAWLFDIIENMYLLKKIKAEPELSSDSVYKAFQKMESSKWAIALLGAVCSVAAMFYFWLTGNYNAQSLWYLLIIIGEIVLMILVKKLYQKKSK